MPKKHLGEEAGKAVGAAHREPTLLYIIKQLELATRWRLDDIFRPLGMTALQYTALTVLEHHPGISGVQLARNSFVTPQSMSDMVETLQDRGLIERRPDPTDRRRLLVSLTPSGRTLLDSYRPVVESLEREMVSELSAAESTELRRLLLLSRSALAKRDAPNDPTRTGVE